MAEETGDMKLKDAFKKAEEIKKNDSSSWKERIKRRAGEWEEKAENRLEKRLANKEDIKQEVLKDKRFKVSFSQTYLYPFSLQYFSFIASANLP